MPPTHRRHPIFARLWAWISPKMEASRTAELRRQLLAGLVGRVIEVGAGNGLNFAHYPSEVTRILAVEPEPRLRDIALRNATRSTLEIEVVEGVAAHVPAADASADAVVFSLTLCSVTDQAVALREARRILKPAESCASSSTSALTAGRSPRYSGCSTPQCGQP